MPETRIPVYMNYGRWLLNCPKCNTPLPAWETGVICPRCYPGIMAKALKPIQGGLLRPVTDIELVSAAQNEARSQGEEYFPAFPPERFRIEKILRMRPDVKHMNWVQAETLEDLRKQNLDHDDPVPKER